MKVSADYELKLNEKKKMQPIAPTVLLHERMVKCNTPDWSKHSKCKKAWFFIPYINLACELTSAPYECFLFMSKIHHLVALHKCKTCCLTFKSWLTFWIGQKPGNQVHLPKLNLKKNVGIVSDIIILLCDLHSIR